MNKTKFIAIILFATMMMLSSRLRADTGMCGAVTTTLPFTDVPGTNIFFCSIAEAFFSGLTNGTSATTYNPHDPVPREQMAAFVTRTMDQSVKRSSKRAALNQYWTQLSNNLTLTTVGDGPKLVQSDGADLWVANNGSATVARVRASDGKLIENWTGATSAFGVLCAMGKVFVAGNTDPGQLYQIDPRQPAGAVTLVSAILGAFPEGIAYDGQRIWTVNQGPPGSVSIVTLNPITVSTVTTGFVAPHGIVYDGNNIWVTDDGAGSVDKLHKLDPSGNVLMSIDVGSAPLYPAFDGTNIWVPNGGSSNISVVRATAGTVVATLSGNGVSAPVAAAFDGERILVTNFFVNSVSVWKATDLTPIATISTGTGTGPFGVCSDGLNFWIAFNAIPGKLARF